MSTRKSPRLPAGRLLPTKRASAGEQIAIARAICERSESFTAKDLETVTGIPASRTSLVMAFWCKCGLAERAPGRGAYQPTALATALAAAWQQGEAQGHGAVRKLWRSQWFVRSTRARCSMGPVVREGVVTKLMRLANVGAEYRCEVDVLVDLMVAVGLLVPQPQGMLRWHEQSQPSSVQPSVTASAPAVDAPHPNQDQPAEAEDPAAAAPIPAPRPPAPSQPPSTDDACAGGVADLIALLSQPFRLADLARLTPDEVVALHRHLAGLTATASKLRSRP